MQPISDTYATVSFFYQSGNPNISLADRRNVYLRVAPCRSYDRRGRPNHINRSGYPSNKDIRVPENDNFKQCAGYAGIKSAEDQLVCCLLFCIVFENTYVTIGKTVYVIYKIHLFIFRVRYFSYLRLIIRCLYRTITISRYKQCK